MIYYYNSEKSFITSSSSEPICSYQNGKLVSRDPDYKCATSTRYWDCSRPTCSWNPNSCKGTDHFPNCANNSGVSGDFASDYNQPYYDPESDTIYATSAVSGSLGITRDGGPACGRCYEIKVDKLCGNPYVKYNPNNPYGDGCNAQRNEEAFKANPKIKIINTNMCPDWNPNEKKGCPPKIGDINVKGSEYHFDIALPGGGVGAADRCKYQYGPQYSFSVWNRNDCMNTSILPQNLRDSCLLYFDRLKAMDNPVIAFKEIPCPNYSSFRKLNNNMNNK